MLKFLDGWKNWIVAAVFLASEISKGVGGPDFGANACAVFAAVGWDCAVSAFDPVAVAASGFALWAVVDKLVKAVKQAKAGASLGEIHTSAGYVKLATHEEHMRALKGLPPKRPA